MNSAVKAGENAVVFNYLTGKFGKRVYSEGFHLRLPIVTTPIIFETRTRYVEETSSTANRDLQNVDFQIRVLYKPDQSKLPEIASEVGINYAEKLLSAIVKEVAKTIIAQYSAQQLVSNRDLVSRDIKGALRERLINFNILLDEVTLTHISFSKEFERSVEEKQIAQQNAERAKYLVQKSNEVKKRTIIDAERESKSIELIGTAMRNSPSYLTFKKIETAQEIAGILATSRNQVLLNSDQLLMHVLRTE